MSQGDVFKILKKEKNWLTSKEIAVKLKVPASQVTSALSKMYKWKEVKRKPVGKPKYVWSLFPSGGYKWKIIN